GVRRVLEVRLASGHVRRTTPQHLWYGFDGWQQLGQLRVGDRVAVARRLPDTRPSVRLPVAAAELADWLGPADVTGPDPDERRLPGLVFRLPPADRQLVLQQFQ